MFTRREHNHRAAEHDHVHDDAHHAHDADQEQPAPGHGARELYGGMNGGADVFGWLVALSVSALLTGVIGAVVAAVNQQANVTQTEAEQQAGTIGLVAAAVLVLVAAIGYYCGGYVAGRMSRFDGARQGLGVWLIGLVVMVVAVGLGALFGREYNVLDRVALPDLPIATDAASLGGIVTALVLLVVTLLAALAGGAVGSRYHRKVDAAQRV